VNGVLLHELSDAVFQLKMQSGINLIELSMNSSQWEPYNFSAERFLKIVESFTALKKLRPHNSYYIWPLLERGKEMASAQAT